MQKLEKLKQGYQSKILNFRISNPRNAQKVVISEDAILLKEPCILGQTVEAFVHFPPRTVKDVGAQSCLTDGLIARGKLGVGLDSQEVLNQSQLM